MPSPPEAARPAGWLPRFVLRLAALCGALASAPAPADAERILPLSAFPTERITIATRGARLLDFTAWRADTARKRAQGLMFVREVPADRAMIFLYAPEQPVAMWMKNTYVPLDMLFVDDRGCVLHLVERAEPLSLATISSVYPVTLVVELRAGTVDEQRIAVGDKVLRPAAGWPAGGTAVNPCTASRPIR